MVPGKLKRFFKTRPTRDRNTREEERVSFEIQSGKKEHI